jgi:squalene-hopene/tetraprenyl-beta-curcumene cyclase
MMMQRWVLAGLGVALLMVALAPAADEPAKGVPAKDLAAVLDKAMAFLKSKQNDDGSFLPKLGGPGVTALVVASSVKAKRADEPFVVKGLAYLEKAVQKDGGIYSKGLANYSTSVGLMAFKEANTGGKYDTIIANGAKFLKSLQFADESGDNPKFGGVGYNGGPKDRPDLSNTHFFLDALLSAGVPKDDPAVKNALKFISKCQNLPGENNKQPFAAKVSPEDKGGFVYNPTADKEEEKTAAGGLRSAGTMTYAGLKSFLYAGVAKDDPRVVAAVDWIKRHYSLDENPGKGDEGLYYYYHLFAKALDALGEDTFTDAKGGKHLWRKELLETLKKKQNADGSWVNKNRAFGEGSPELATAFAVLALSYCPGK